MVRGRAFDDFPASFISVPYAWESLRLAFRLYLLFFLRRHLFALLLLTSFSNTPYYVAASFRYEDAPETKRTAFLHLRIPLLPCLYGAFLITDERVRDLVAELA